LSLSGADQRASSAPAICGQSVIKAAAEKPNFSKALRVSPGMKLPTALADK
jgi:hypothetical protein